MSRCLLIVIVTTCVFTSTLIAENSEAQSIKKVKISIELHATTIEEALAAIEKKTEFKFEYDKRKLSRDQHRLFLTARDESVAALLKQIANQTGLSFRQVNTVIAIKTGESPRSKPGDPNPDAARPEYIIRGKVTDESGDSLAGANVFVKGTAIGTTTDVEGNYRLNVPDETTTLIFSYIGYVTEEVEIAGRSVINMVMLPDVTALEEITVSTGYWEVDERLNPGNIAKVDAKVIGQQPVVNPLEAIQGRMTGVQIIQTSGVPGSAIDIRIRGVNSLNNGQRLNDLDGTTLINSNRPFFVVDGVPYTNTTVNSIEDSPTGLGNPLAFLQPSDIESIEVLKDADATAIYGSRGANGVVLITTKKGQAGRTSVDVNYSRGWGELASKADVLTTEQFLEITREGANNLGIDPALFEELTVWNQERETDWQEVLLGGVAEQTNFGARVFGGNANTTFSFGANYFSQGNVYNFDDSKFQKISTLLNVNHTTQDQRLQFNLSSNFTYNINRQNGNQFSSLALQLAPNAPELFSEDGSLNWENSTWDNPLAALNREFENISKNLVLNATISYQIMKGLKASTRLGYTNLDTEEVIINPLTSFDPARVANGQEGFNTFGSGNAETWIVEPQLSYLRDVSKGRLSVLVGTSFQGDVRERESLSGIGYTNDALIRDIFSAREVRIVNTEFIEYNYTAFFGRVNYTWDDKYLFNLTGRRDGSSRFGPGNQFGNFGAVGAAWIFSKESLVKSALPFLGFGKLRGSYGSVGNDQIGDYQYLTSYASTVAYNGNQALLPSRAANLNFGWETTTKLEFGLELGFWDDRVQLNTSWYRNRTSDQLIGRPLPGTTGFSFIQFNLPAIVENRGWEVELNTVNVRAGDFSWLTGFNISIPENELLEFPGIEEFAAFDATYEVGRPILGSKQYQPKGVNPETGIYDFVDFNRDGTINALDRQFFVSEVQDFFGGLNNNFSYKGFQLAIFFDFVKQDDRRVLSFSQYDHPNILNRWQAPGDITNVQKSGAPSTERVRGRGYFREDASFIRLRNVSFSWQLPGPLLDSIKIQRGRIYVQGQNLLTLTSYDGWDPETGVASLPPLRIITTGVQLTF